MSRNLRAIGPLTLPNVVPAPISSAAPVFKTVDPRRLHVDQDYQRNLSARSIKLISRIISDWDWARFKPPVVANVDGEMHVIDGQHTAIAAVTHGGIAEIPVMLVDAPEARDRARAFVGHNRDRLSITPHQIYYAELAAGDEMAQTISQVCAHAGIKVLKSKPIYGRYEPGDTLSVGTVRSLISSLGAMRARVVLQTLVAARCAPVSSDLIKAANELLTAPEYKSVITKDQLIDAVRVWGGAPPDQVTQLAAARKIPKWRALVIYIATQRGRDGSSRRAAA